MAHILAIRADEFSSSDSYRVNWDAVMKTGRASRLVFGSASVLAVTGLLAACGTDSTPSQPEVKVVTVTVAASADSGSTNAVATDTGGTTAANPRGVTPGVIPNVVGINHQLAQDTMQAAGFYNLSEEDATGAGRMLIIDSNWVVVSQSPAPGTRPPSDTTIILRSKKIGE